MSDNSSGEGRGGGGGGDDDERLPLIVIGGGGHARVLLDLIESLGRHVLFITDRDARAHGQRVMTAEIRGSDDLIFGHAPAEVLLVNAIGSVSPPFGRRDVYERFHARGYKFATLIHPSATIAHGASLGEGTQVMAGVVVQPGVVVGENALINTSASIDHDCVIGAHVHVGPGVTLSGDVRVGDTTHLGTGATVIQGIKIGREVMAGADSVVVRNVPDGQRVLGVPARPLPATVPAAAAPPAPRREAAGDKAFTIMLSAAGRRVSLLRLLEQSAVELGLNVRMLATDITPLSAAFNAGVASRLVPRYSEPDCLDRLLEMCREMAVSLIVPTIDPDLPFYAEHRARFEAIGTRVMVSSAETIRIASDKQLTYEWLTRHGFPSLPQMNARTALENGSGSGGAGWQYPLFVKPRRGSSSVGARTVRNVEELRLAAGDDDDDYIVQRVARGQEYTVDVYIDHAGRCACAVPRLRIETRGGEVNKGMTVRCAAVEDLAHRVAEALPGAWGVLNIQIFYDPAGAELVVSEINPRFGGGYPLTHQAGAPMARWIVEEVTGLPLSAANDRWADGLLMLRFDDAVFVPAGALDTRSVDAAAAAATKVGAVTATVALTRCDQVGTAREPGGCG